MTYQLVQLPLDEWKGPPTGFRVYSHSTELITPENFGEVIDEGFRVSRSGLGDLGITFLTDYSNIGKLRKNLRDRVTGNWYNLGPRVVLAGINPELQQDRGVEDKTLEYARCTSERIRPGLAMPIRNVNVLEQYPEGHRWRDNAWALPGRFLLALYDGLDDTVYLNPNFEGSTGTEYGKRLSRNWKEYLEITQKPIIVEPVEPVKPYLSDWDDSELDDFVF